MTQLLPVSQLVNVTINLASQPAQSQSLSNLLIVGSSGVIDSIEGARTYSTINAIAEDFGTTAPEYLAALEWFGQSPQPSQCLIGQWYSPALYPTGADPMIIGSTIATTLAQFKAITNGSFKYDDSVVTPTEITGLNFYSVSNFNGIASIIQTAIDTVLGSALATFVWNSVLSRFELTVANHRDLQFFTSAATGTDISTLLGLSATSSGAYIVPFLSAPVSAVDAVVDFDDRFGQKFYGVVVLGATDDDHLAVAAYIEASNTKHAYGVNTQEAGVISTVDTSNIAHQLKALGYKKTVVQYSSKSRYAVISLLARILTTDYTDNKSVITLKFKQEPGVMIYKAKLFFFFRPGT